MSHYTDKLEDLLARQIAIASELRAIKSNFLGCGQDIWLEVAEEAEDLADETAMCIRRAHGVFKDTI
jgi:hypothetical protein